jgi:hypothetical protein
MQYFSTTSSIVAEASYQRYWRTGLGDEYTFILLLKRFRFMARQCGCPVYDSRTCEYVEHYALIIANGE